jgi:oligopeptide/dipeptide ABC transporter ATP-binding protein
VTTPLLGVEGLTKHYRTSGALGGGGRVIRAVDGVSFAIDAGQTLALVGESGSGKTTTAQMVLLLEKPTAGTIRFRGVDISSADRRVLREYRQAVQAVFQDPYSSLNPRMRVEEIVGEPLRIHGHLGRRELRTRVGELLEQVGLQPKVARYFPHMFSGGQRQRIAIARALSLQPQLIILDEPVSALDVSIRAQILNLLVDLQRDLGLSYLLISHDLAIVEHMSQRVAVMYAGRLVETAPVDRLYAEPAHPYTTGLMAAVPSLDPDVPLHDVVGGEVANPGDLPAGCRFHPRCPLRRELGEPAICIEEDPALLPLAPEHACACHFRRPASAEAGVASQALASVSPRTEPPTPVA